MLFWKVCFIIFLYYVISFVLSLIFTLIIEMTDNNIVDKIMDYVFDYDGLSKMLLLGMLYWLPKCYF